MHWWTDLRRVANMSPGLVGSKAGVWYGALRGDPLAGLFLDDGQRDPYARYAQMRARGPVVKTPLGLY